MTRLIMFLIVATFLNGTVRANAQDRQPQQDTATTVEVQVAMADIRIDRSLAGPSPEPGQVLFYTPSVMAYHVEDDADASNAELVRADGPPVNLRPEDN